MLFKLYSFLPIIYHDFSKNENAWSFEFCVSLYCLQSKTMLVQRTICINIGQFVIVTGQIVASNFK